MSLRTAVINTLIDHVAAATTATGHRGYRFLHEINDFPSFYVAITGERRIHRGAGTRFALLSADIRGYYHGDSLDNIEMYARTLETAVQTYRSILKTPTQDFLQISGDTDFIITSDGSLEQLSSLPALLALVDEARVTSLSTDEGVMSPYGVVDITLEILYQINKEL